MNYLLAAVFCVTYSLAAPLTMVDFTGLYESEAEDIQRDASASVDALDVTQEQHQVLLNYLYIAARSAKVEHVFVEKYAEFQHDLAHIKETQRLSDEDRTALAHRFAALNQLAGIKSEHAKALDCIEAYVDEREEYDASIDTLRQYLTEVLTQSLESRLQLIDALLLASDAELKDDMLPLIGRFCRALAYDPELLVDSASLALNRVDAINALSQQLDAKITAAAEVKDAMQQVVYFTLLATHYYLKHCYGDLYAHYRATYQEEPRLLFSDSGMLADEQQYLLPEELFGN